MNNSENDPRALLYLCSNSINHIKILFSLVVRYTITYKYICTCLYYTVHHQSRGCAPAVCIYHFHFTHILYVVESVVDGKPNSKTKTKQNITIIIINLISYQFSTYFFYMKFILFGIIHSCLLYMDSMAWHRRIG